MNEMVFVSTALNETFLNSFNSLMGWEYVNLTTKCKYNKKINFENFSNGIYVLLVNKNTVKILLKKCKIGNT